MVLSRRLVVMWFAVVMTSLVTWEAACAQGVAPVPRAVPPGQTPLQNMAQPDAIDLMLRNIEAVDRQIANSVASLTSAITWFSGFIILSFSALTLFEIWKIRNIRSDLQQYIDDRFEKQIGDHYRAYKSDLNDYIAERIDKAIQQELGHRIQRIESRYASNISSIEGVMDFYLANEWRERWDQGKHELAFSDLHKFRKEITRLMSNDPRERFNALGNIKDNHIKYLSDITMEVLQSLLCSLHKQHRFFGRDLAGLAGEVLAMCSERTGRDCADFEEAMKSAAQPSSSEAVI
jgi:hypothetical protein